MADFKLVINNPKDGKSYSREIKDPAAETFIGKKIGDKVDGKEIDMTGYEFEIAGGSDHCGFPMRADVDSIRKKILAVSGVGMKKTASGMRHRKTVAGNKIHARISQINLKILKYGKQKLGEEKKETEEKEEQPKPKGKKEEKKKEKPAEEPKPKGKKEETEKEKPAEEPKPAEKKEEQAKEDKKKPDESKEKPSGGEDL